MVISLTIMIFIRVINNILSNTPFDLRVCPACSIGLVLSMNGALLSILDKIDSTVPE